MRSEGGPRRQQSTVFGEVAELYDRVRPGYPDVLVDDVLELTDSASPRVLEVGAGTGKATVPFAERDLAIVALEPSTEMAGVARQNCARFPRVSIVVSSFEDWPPQGEPFDLLISAQAWHWVSPDVRYHKARKVLAPRGAMAVFWNRPRWGDSPLRLDLDEAYSTLVPDLKAREPGFPGLTTPGVDEDRAREIEDSGVFGPVIRRSYRWSSEYTAAEFVALLQTQSDHRMLPSGRRKALFEAVAAIIDDSGGVLRVDYTTQLCVAGSLPFTSAS